MSTEQAKAAAYLAARKANFSVSDVEVFVGMMRSYLAGKYFGDDRDFDDEAALFRELLTYLLVEWPREPLKLD